MAKYAAPFVSSKATYDGTGKVLVFTNATPAPRKAEYLMIQVHSGTALVCLTGDSTGTFIELTSSKDFSFPMLTESVWIKGSGGSAVVTVIAGLFNDGE